MSGTRQALDFLQSDERSFPAIIVLFGDEVFLKRLVRTKLRNSLLGPDPTTPYTQRHGDTLDWCDVVDELATVSLFGGGSRRLFIVEDADGFVSKFRSQLEDYVAHPRRTGVLVLEVGTWASNTRLYKAVDKDALQIDCHLPQKTVGKRSEFDEGRLIKWLVDRTKAEHDAVIDLPAARLLWELAGPDLGMVDQDLAKLALFAGVKGKITAKLVQDVVGGWRAKTIWEVVEAAANGDTSEALRQLDLALQSGEHPQALYGQISWSLRRFTVATRIYQQAQRRGERLALRDALLQAGFRQWPPEALANAEKQLIQLGRERAGKLLHWLLELDLAMKGSHATPDRARFALEMLFLRQSSRAKPAV